MIMKIVSAAVGALLPILANAGIQYETTQQQTVLQETLTKMCPMVWANIDTVTRMPRVHSRSNGGTPRHKPEHDRRKCHTNRARRDQRRINRRIPTPYASQHSNSVVWLRQGLPSQGVVTMFNAISEATATMPCACTPISGISRALTSAALGLPK